MKVPGLSAAVTALLSVAVDARNVGWLPKATQSVVLPLDGMTAKPTPPPGLHELVRRQDGASSYTLTMAVAPDNTCGYISANPTRLWACESGMTCGLVLSGPTHSGVLICNGTNFFTGCVDYTAFYSSSSCNPACASNSLLLKWYETLSSLSLRITTSSIGYCGTIVFPGGITDYECNSFSNSVATMAFTTFSGQTGRHYSTTILIWGASKTLLNTASAAPSASASATSTSGGGNGSDKTSETPVGAIVGGAVGGLAAIGIAGIALLLLLRNKNKKQGLQEKIASPPKYHPLPISPQGPPQNIMPGQHQPGQQPPAGFQPQQPVIHEAPNQTSENRRGRMHELA
ncbi:Uncharacterized protein TPAR_07490 [Tolypocladium paradoxum]|uniref:Transmembrane protein n=1 Tax=Tolypocladium paradoxum TaxID=94208 RepID=A0A2S4KQ40_9HYPO|nr:Uncharacterized protein TPAR_07490 [Tolypocladium paradoxum]